jgi:hypothetical protein
VAIEIPIEPPMLRSIFEEAGGVAHLLVGNGGGHQRGQRHKDKAQGKAGQVMGISSV